MLHGHNIHAASVMIFLTAAAIVVFWRTVIKYMIILAATTIIALVAYGAVMVVQITHHLHA